MLHRTTEKGKIMTVPQQRVYYAVFVVTAYESLDDAFASAPDMVAAHIARSQELHACGTLLMVGAFLNNPQEPLSTMAIHTTREAAKSTPKAIHSSRMVWCAHGTSANGPICSLSRFDQPAMLHSIICM